jgi:hypothetical protein
MGDRGRTRRVRVCARAHEHRAAIGCGTLDQGGRCGASRARPIHDGDGLTPAVRERAGECAADEIGSATGAERIDQPDRAPGERVRCRRWHGRDRTSL